MQSQKENCGDCVTCWNTYVKRSCTQRQILGIGLLLLTVLLWVSSSELISYIFGESDYNKPFFLTYIDTNLFSLYLLGFLFMPAWKCCENRKSFYELVKDLVMKIIGNTDKIKDPDSDDQPASGSIDSHSGDSNDTNTNGVHSLHKRKNSAGISSPSIDDEGMQLAETSIITDVTQSHSKTDSMNLSKNNLYTLSEGNENDLEITKVEIVKEGEIETKEEIKKMTVFEVVKVAALFCPIWFAANYTFNLSLGMTGVSSNTIISSTSSFWSLLLGAVLGAEKFSFFKFIACLATIGGVTLVGLTDFGESHFWGDFWALVSAMCYAGYAVFLKLMIKHEERVHICMFFGFVGAINVFLMLPFGIILDVTGIEKFEMPSLKVFYMLLVNGVIGTVLSDVLWMMSLLLTSPVVATIGLSLTIPVSMIADAVLHGDHYNATYISGALLVIIGFFLVNLDRQLSELFRKIISLVWS